jgi:hypothetical protein
MKDKVDYDAHKSPPVVAILTSEPSESTVHAHIFLNKLWHYPLPSINAWIL